MEDPTGGIQTNDIERLQKIIPFTLVFPKYLPEDLKKYPAWMLQKTISGNPGLMITIQYDNHILKNPKSVYIDESNSIKWGINQDMYSDNLTFKGINIIEQKTTDPFMPSDTPNQQDEYHYFWEQNGIYFHASIDGCDKSEARKIIDSIIT